MAFKSHFVTEQLDQVEWLELDRQTDDELIQCGHCGRAFSRNSQRRGVHRRTESKLLRRTKVFFCLFVALILFVEKIDQLRTSTWIVC